MRPARLITRRRIGMQIFVAIESKAVKRTGMCWSAAREVAVGFRGEREEFADCISFDRRLNRDVDPLGFRRPNAEMRLAGRDQFRADRKTPLRLPLHTLSHRRAPK